MRVSFIPFTLAETFAIIRSAKLLVFIDNALKITKKNGTQK